MFPVSITDCIFLQSAVSVQLHRKQNPLALEGQPYQKEKNQVAEGLIG
jgi:hypothetical protein